MTPRPPNEPPRGASAARRALRRLWGPDVDEDVDDELRFHLEMRARDFEARGLPPDQAWRAAAERFGDVDRIGGELRDHDRHRQRREHRREYVSDLTQDLRYGLRALRRAPGFAAIAVLTLGLGIGATTAIFSVVNTVILRPLPYPDAERLTMVWMDNQRMGMSEDIHSWPNYTDLAAQNAVFDGMGAFTNAGYNLTGGCVEGECEPRRVVAAVVTASILPVLGVRPILGRGFDPTEEEPGKDAVVLISHGLWQRQFAGATDAIGQTIRLNGRERTVVGVLPAGYAFPSPEVEVLVPLALSPQNREARSSFGLRVIGRLKPGITIERAQADMSAIFARLVQQYPDLEGFGINLESLPEQVVGKTLRTALWIMLGAVAMVLLIACANVANLMLSRAAAREREVSVRIALGAGRTRLVRQLLTESVLLALLGGAFGVALAWIGLRALLATAPADVPRLGDVRLDGLVLAVTLVVSLLTGLLFGLVPALQASRPDLSEGLREGGRGGTITRRGQLLRRALVVGQVALVLVLLAGAGLLVRSFIALQRVDLGFRPDGLLTMRLALPMAKYQEPDARVAFYRNLMERIDAIPGVDGAGAISSIFLSRTPNSTIFAIEGRTFSRQEAGIEVPLDAVTPDYFRVMGIPLRAGRAFDARDIDGAPEVVMINESMARRFWPDTDPIGKRLKYGGQDSDGPWLTIVGVVGDMRRTGFDDAVRYETFLPHGQTGSSQLTLVVRAAAGREPLALARAVRAEVRGADADLPVYEMRSMDQLIAGMVAQRRFSMTLLGTFAALALVLGLVGVYGVTSYIVAQRTREVGLRLALGAQPAQVVRMVVRQGMTTAVLGVALGLIASLVVTRLMASLLYQVSPTDAPTLVIVAVLLATATLAANWIPAWRAARVDPLVALRAE